MTRAPIRRGTARRMGLRRPVDWAPVLHEFKFPELDPWRQYFVDALYRGITRPVSKRPWTDWLRGGA